MKTQALAVKYRLNSQTPKKPQVFAKVMRVKTLNAMHAAGAFNLPSEESSIESRKTSAGGRVLVLEDLDSYDFDCKY